MSGKNNPIQIVGNKTPKMIVLEVCVKMKVVPQWDVTNIATSVTSPPRFKCVCSVHTPVGEEFIIIGEGVGGTKKEAEHSAALEVIQQILTPAEVIELTTIGGIVKKKEEILIGIDDDPISDTDDDRLTGEPIGDLNNICVKHKWELPCYSEASRKGPGNTNVFTVTCKALSIVKTGRRLRLKDAKKMAAFRVLSEIKAGGYAAETPKLSYNITPPRPVLLKPTQQSSVSSSSTHPMVSSFSSDQTDHEKSVLDEDENVLQQSLTLILEKLKNNVKRGKTAEPMDVDDGHPVASSSKAKESSKENKQLAGIHQKIKRKLEGQNDDALLALSSLSKRKYDPFAAVKCVELADASVVSQKFQELLDRHGGSLNLFMKTASDLKIKFQFGPVVKLDGNEKCVFLMMFYPLNLQQKIHNQTRHTVHGIGRDYENAKENAAFQGLKFIKLMVLDETE